MAKYIQKNAQTSLTRIYVSSVNLKWLFTFELWGVNFYFKLKLKPPRPFLTHIISSRVDLKTFNTMKQHPTPAGAGIMVRPGNDTRDSPFLPPDARPGVSYRKIKFPETSPGSSIHKLWISWFPVENKKVFCLITNINLPLMIIGNIFSVQLYVTTQLRTLKTNKKHRHWPSANTVASSHNF